MSTKESSIATSVRIRELAAINNDISAMLSCAGNAVSALTGRSVDAENSTAREANTAFERHARAYYETLQAICVRLNRQAHALEEAGIIAAEAPILTLADTRKGAFTGMSTGGAAPNADGERIRNGGLGNFDVGWLNSRGNKVGMEMEAEIMSKVKALSSDWRDDEHLGTRDHQKQSEDVMSMAADADNS